MTDALHHLHKRKRIHEKHESYPNPNKWKALMDKFIYIVGIAGPLMLVPQILKIWINKNASGVSMTSFIGFGIIAIFWLIYGIIHKEKPIILTYSLFILFNVLVIIGIFIYG